jgi:hypothetical protein
MITFKSLEEVKSYAKQQLEKTDYVVLPDTNIANKNEFVIYRNFVRLLYLNPNYTPFPTEPTPIWNQPNMIVIGIQNQPTTDIPTE